MRTGFAAFRFALVGFTLPYMFVLRPALLMLDDSGAASAAMDVVIAVVVAVLGIVPFAAGIAGHLFTNLSPLRRGLLVVASAMLLVPGRTLHVGESELPLLGVGGLLLFAGVALVDWSSRRQR
jgi:TRAP-type uncharacterized transport system fused permease subunit